jgi:hypothetical protein
MQALEVERRYYSKNLSRLMKDFPGKVVVIKGESLIGAYDDIDQALSAGASKFGLDSFLARPVGQMEEVVTIPALTLGLLNANPPRTDNRTEQGA